MSCGLQGMGGRCFCESVGLAVGSLGKVDVAFLLFLFVFICLMFQYKREEETKGVMVKQVATLWQIVKPIA